MEFCETLETYLYETGRISALAKRQARLLCRSVADENLQTETRILLLLNLASLTKGAPRASKEFLLDPLRNEAVKQHITTYRAEKAGEEPSWSCVLIDPATMKHIGVILEKVILDPNRLAPVTGGQHSENDAPDKKPEYPLLVINSNIQQMGFSRFWRAAVSLESTMLNRLKQSSDEIPARIVSEIITQVFDTDSILDKDKHFHIRQVAAAALALRTSFMIVSGGPGTGKTSVVVQILRVLLRAFEDISPDRIVLCAPTGRAKARIGESLDDTIGKLEEKHAAAKRASNAKDLALKNIPRKTIHNLLCVRPDGSTKYDSGNPLPFQIIVVDEAGMVDLHLFAALMDAAAPGCRILLMGDMHQLPSVEAGAVLGDLTDRFIGLAGHPTLTPATGTWVATVIGNTAMDGDATRELSSLVLSTKNLVRQARPIADHVVILTYPYRSTQHIVDLGDFVNRPDCDAALKLLSDNPDVALLDARTGVDPIIGWLNTNFPDEKIEFIKNLWRLDIEVINAPDNPKHATIRRALANAFDVLDASRILTLVHEGERGRIAINALADRLLRPRVDPGSRTRFFHGQEVIVGSNHHDLDLFNGDTGIVVQSKDGGLKAVFRRGRTYAIHAIDRLSDLEPAFAITVHKAQGSEFGAVLLVLPEYNSPLLSRQIIYTGITRAKRTIRILGNEDLLRLAISSREERSGGVTLKQA